MNLHNIYINAILADASYAYDLIDGLKGSDLEKALSLRMTPALAKFMAREFSVVSHLETDDEWMSGFDGTIWRSTSDKKIFVSLQGTKGLGDMVADTSLALDGMARMQIADMVNWWLRETGGPKDKVAQIRVSVRIEEGDGITQFFEKAPDVFGTGHIAADDLAKGVEVNGHSLGGYLASAFLRLFNLQVPKIHAATFNSAGFAFGSDKAFMQLESLLGPGLGAGRYPNKTDQDNFFAENGLNAVTNTWWFTQTGERQPIFNEQSVGIPNHFMYKLTDTLSVADIMAQLDKSFDRNTLSYVLKHSSDRSNGSLENLLDALTKTFVDENLAPTPIGDVEDSAASRVTFYDNLSRLIQADEKGKPTGIVADLSGKVRINLPTNSVPARSDELSYLPYLLSLKYLLPIQVTPYFLDGLAIITARHMSLADKIASDRVDFDIKERTGALNFSDLYLSSRSLMLKMVIERNRTDSTGIAPYPNLMFYDTVTNTTLRSGSSDSGDAGRRQILFGGEYGNLLQGGDR
ncbi:hypothetical protein [Massilia genomosp. 1]|uniref:Fungal lipase-like domain-containing protein n=1 Tax=Massilia genomosp. 1 TaxID=2609280 RepID=A0ABX0MWN6_9BURK|nr:hypothetical protein [Massilia genomosp. 1]NHZ66896.1 hypothetical protein [Massilia genomosp. 1]